MHSTPSLSRRAFREAKDASETIAYLESGYVGRLLDPEVFEALKRVVLRRRRSRSSTTCTASCSTSEPTGANLSGLPVSEQTRHLATFSP
jgi:hypothetical protein